MAKRKTLYLKGLTVSFDRALLKAQGNKTKCKDFILHVVELSPHVRTEQDVAAIDALVNDIFPSKQTVNVPKQDINDNI